MLVHREINDQALARFLQEAPEDALRAVMADVDFDREVADAVRHSVETEGYEDLRDAGEFLDDLRAEGRL